MSKRYIVLIYLAENVDGYETEQVLCVCNNETDYLNNLNTLYKNYKVSKKNLKKCDVIVDFYIEESCFNVYYEYNSELDYKIFNGLDEYNTNANTIEVFEMNKLVNMDLLDYF